MQTAWKYDLKETFLIDTISTKKSLHTLSNITFNYQKIFLFGEFQVFLPNLLAKRPVLQTVRYTGISSTIAILQEKKQNIHFQIEINICGISHLVLTEY